MDLVNDIRHPILEPDPYRDLIHPILDKAWNVERYYLYREGNKYVNCLANLAMEEPIGKKLLENPPALCRTSFSWMPWETPQLGAFWVVFG